MARREIVRVEVEGLREIDQALGEMKQSTARGVMRRVLLAAAAPIAADYAGSVRRRSGQLAESAGTGTRLTTRQGRLHRKMFRDDRASVEVFAGAGGLTQAITEEFGTVDQAPQGDLRRAWDRHKPGLIGKIRDGLWPEIEKTAARARSRTARLMRRAARTGRV